MKLSYFLLPCTIIISLLLGSCGFQLASQKQIPKQLHTLHIQSNNPYGNFSKQIVQALKLRNIHIVRNASDAPYTFKITTYPLSILQTSQGTDQLTREFTLTLTAGFSIISNRNHKIISNFNLAAAQSITVFSGQLLSNSDQEKEVEATLQRTILQQIFFYLNADSIRKTLNADQLHKAKKKPEPA